jgi:crotonobetainyl-CoA:carnitine CoA-transferase CaiB-like acyl-CoA transferase
MTGPLDGLKVVDMTTVMMGPYATQLMAEMGADVVKVEAPGGDSVRGAGQSRNPGMSALFLQANQGKRSIVLDLKTAPDRDVLNSLIAKSDVLVTNVRTEALKRLGITYDALHKVNPRLIFAVLNGFGENGPYSGKPAYDDLIQGAVGLPRLIETAGATEPRYVPVTISDRVVGLYALNAILAALFARSVNGCGQAIEVPMFESMAHFVLGDHLGGGIFDPPVGAMGYQRLLSKHRHPYATKDGYVCTMIYNDSQWQRFFDAVGRRAEYDSDPRFNSITSRTQHVDEIYTLLAAELAKYTTEECIALLEGADLPVGPLNSLGSLLNDPHLKVTGFFREVQHPSEGTLLMPSFPARFSSSTTDDIRPAPRLGEHTDEVLQELRFPVNGTT